MEYLEKSWENPTPDNEKDRTLYRRHLDWVNFAKNNMQSQESFNARSSLSNPITHATEVMTDVLRVIPEVYIREQPKEILSTSDLTSVAVNSYQTTAYLAGFEIFSFVHAKRYLIGQRMDRQLSADQFILVEDTRGGVGNWCLQMNLNMILIKYDQTPISCRAQDLLVLL